MGWVQYEADTEGGAKDFIKKSVISNQKGNVTLYENGGLFVLIKQEDENYYVWETDFHVRSEAQNVLATL